MQGDLRGAARSAWGVARPRSARFRACRSRSVSIYRSRTSAPLILGGIASWPSIAARADERREQITLLASGLVAGDALMGIGVAALVSAGSPGHVALRTPGSGGIEDSSRSPRSRCCSWLLVYGKRQLSR